MARWFDPRDGQIKWAPDPPGQQPAAKAPTMALPQPKDDESSTLVNGRPMWVTRNGEITWNPDLVADHSRAIGLHEAAHCVANYLLGRQTHSAEAAERKGLTLVPKTDDTFASVLSLLAGEAFERSIGLPPSGTMKDIKEATKLLEREGLSGRSLDEACSILEEAAIELVASERFQTLVFALGPVIAKERYVGERQIRRILEEADRRPGMRSAERHSQSGPVMAPWYKVFSHQGKTGRLLYEGDDEAEASRIARLHPHSMKVGSIYS